MNGAESAPFSCLPEVLRGMWSYWVRAAGVMFITLAGTSVHAGIVLSATRVIYPEKTRKGGLKEQVQQSVNDLNLLSAQLRAIPSSKHC